MKIRAMAATLIPPARNAMTSACLVDISRCIGCRSCQVACKQSNGLRGEATKFFARPGGYQNPARFSPNTYTFVSYHESTAGNGEPSWAFVKRQCLHCRDLYCTSVCAPDVFHRNEQGIVVCDADRCMGCGACIDACPFEVPAIDYWDVDTPHIRKCEFCFDRQKSRSKTKNSPARLNGKPLEGQALDDYRESCYSPACATACPTGAIQFGTRKELLTEARRRIATAPDKYVDHIYGEKEAGGTAWLYISAIPFKKLGFPTVFAKLGIQSRIPRMG